MKTENLFYSVDCDTLSAIVKSLERRWGLTLVSFLPPVAQAQIIELQGCISGLWDKRPGENNIRHGRPYIEFYEPEQFHCTHLTLRRSDPSGPVLATVVLKGKSDLYQMFTEIHKVTSQIGPIQAVLDRLRITKDGYGLILLGECVGDASIKARTSLLKALNKSLSELFDITIRDWDNDASKFHSVHASLGYLKREPPQGYGDFVKQIESLRFEPMLFDLQTVTLVHHRYRTLAFPQEGYIDFPLGRVVDMTARQFLTKINIDETG